MLQYQIDRIEHQVADDRAQTGVFLIGPLERGQATTLGNSLRRVLMGGLEGSAITAVRIAGVNHEYATIPGVREDVLDILLNCKQLSVNSRTNEQEIGRLVVAGPAQVKAKDLQFSSQVQIVVKSGYSRPFEKRGSNLCCFINSLTVIPGFKLSGCDL